jgi:2',3'-cyclic-nucleotide 2'-phosphodiesterase (5'-nucleotidase family)
MRHPPAAEPPENRTQETTGSFHSFAMAQMYSLFFVAAAGLAGAIQPDARAAVAAPLRDLPWAQLNILHTTDVHGWFGGHLQEYGPHIQAPCAVVCLS